MNPMNDPMPADARIAVASSIGDGRERWTELDVFYLPGARRCWVARVLGLSAVPGERTKERRLPSASLHRALSLFDDTDLGIIVRESAKEWAEENGVPMAPATYQPATDSEALASLMGVDADALSLRAAARMLGVGESTMRAAMKDGRDIKVPLRTLLPFVDRAAFRDAQKRRASREG